MIHIALLQERGDKLMEPEINCLREELQERGIEIRRFTAKRLMRRQVPLAKDVLVAGDIPVVLGALRQLEVDLPAPNDYPACLTRFLRRRIWQSNVGRITARLEEGWTTPVFVKPMDRLKRFTGRVFETSNDLLYLSGVSRALPVWCSEVVEWRSEYRVFIIQSEIVGIKHYRGDVSSKIDTGIVQESVALLKASGEAKAGYAIDFGVLDDGSTAFVELNDGFSIGCYGLDKGLYADLIIARWCELTGCAE